MGLWEHLDPKLMAEYRRNLDRNDEIETDRRRLASICSGQLTLEQDVSARVPEGWKLSLTDGVPIPIDHPVDI